MPIDDVLDIIDVVFAADTYDNTGRAVVRAADLFKNAAAGAFAKGSGPIAWGFRGIDYLVEESGVDLPPGLREQIRREAEQAKSGAFTGGVIPNDDAAGSSATSGQRASDTGSDGPASDRIATGVFDP